MLNISYWTLGGPGRRRHDAKGAAQLRILVQIQGYLSLEQSERAEKIRLMHQSTGYVAVPKSGHSQTCLASHTFNIEYCSTEILMCVVAHFYQDSASSENI